ncbi:MAG: hypothetical protein ACJ8D6_00170 [Sphingomicrobium sp.]
MIEHGRARIPVRITNLSEHGALVVGRGLPAGETAVTFHCNGVAVDSFVAWSSSGRAGIQFESPVQAAALTQRIPAPASALVKAAPNQDFRRPGFRGNQLTDGERRVVADWHRPQPKPSK